MNNSEQSQRIESIDVLRGITILVMLFVNDIAGVSGVPQWMRHMPMYTDAMTFVDIVFPAFLFIVGMSIPFAIGRRLGHGDSMVSIWKHIIVRTLALLCIGVFMVNTESIGENGILNTHVWILLMYAGVILVWNTLPREEGKKRLIMLWLRRAGFILLVIMALLYKGKGEPGLIEMRTSWWGILGLIGWAYLVACLVYIPLRNRPAGLIGAMALLYCLFLADQGGYFDNLSWLKQWVNIGCTLGSHSAIVVSGIVLGKILMPDSDVKSGWKRIRWAVLYGAGLAATAVMIHSLHDLHNMFIYSKIIGTVPWCLMSSAVTVWIWILTYWLIDVRGWKRWAVIIRPAGNNPLFAYILAPVCYSLIALSAVLFGGFNFFEELGGSFAVGFWRSVIFAFAMTWLAGGLRLAGIWLKL